MRVWLALLRAFSQKAYEEQKAGENGGNELRHPEGVPHADGAEGEGEKIGDEHDDEIAQKGDDERGHPHAESFEGAADDDRERRDDEPRRDDAKGGSARFDGRIRFRKQPHELLRDGEAEDGTHRHHADAQKQGQAEDGEHAVSSPRAEVVSDEGADALHDTAHRKVDEGLQFIVDAEDEHIRLRKRRKDGVEQGDHEGGQRHVERGGDAHRIELEGDLFLCGLAEADLHGDVRPPEDDEIGKEGEALPDARRERRAHDAHFGDGAEARDEDGVEDDVRDGAHRHAEHRRDHLARRLQNFLEGEAQRQHGRKGDDDIEVFKAVRDGHFVLREHAKEGRDEEAAQPREQHAVDGAQKDAERGGAVGFAVALRPQIEGDRRVDAHAEADAHGVRKVLQREDEGDGGHGALVPLRDEVTVDNVVERVDEHGEDDGKRHLQHEGQDGLFFHEGLIHKLAPLRWG